MQVFSFPAWSVVPIHLSQPGACVKVAVAAVAVLTVAISSRDGAAVGTIRAVGLLGELEALDASDGERQMGSCSVDAVTQAEVVGQLLPQIVLLLALTLEGIQGLLQLTLRNVLQTQCVFQLTVEKDSLLLEDFNFMFQPLILNLRRSRKDGQEQENTRVENISFNYLNYILKNKNPVC